MDLYRNITTKYLKRHTVYEGVYNGMKILVRMADHEDYDTILSISKGVYSGLDYIPTKYHWFVDTGRTFPCLLHVDDKPAVFAMIYAFEERACIVLSARTVPQHEGKGLINLLSTTFAKFVVNEVAVLQCHFSVGLMDDKRAARIKKSNVTPILSWKDLIFELGADVTNNEIFPSSENVMEVNTEEVGNIFRNTNNINSIFKSERFAGDKPKLPYKVNRENIISVSQRNLVFVTKTENRSTSTNSKNCYDIDSLSFASSYWVPSGILFEIFYYGKVQLSILGAHIIKSLQRLRENNSDRVKSVTFIVYFPCEFEIEDVEHLLLECKLGKLRVNQSAPTVTNVVQIEFFETAKSKL